MLKWLAKNINNRKGFTLVELVVVITILGVLSTIAIPKFSKATEKANRTVVEANLKAIESAAALYEADKGEAPKNIEDIKKEGFLQSEPKGPDKVTYSWNSSAKKAEANKNSSGSWWTANSDKVSLPVDWNSSSEEEN